MIGRLDPTHREVTVVGAGIAGLLAAYRLDRAGWVVTVIEADTRAGGLIRTAQTPFGIAEAAAHSFQVSAPVSELCDELGVALEPVRPDSRAKFIFRQGRLRRMPLGPLALLKALLRAYFVLADRKASPRETTMSEWARRFLGAAVHDALIVPMVKGIYAASPAEITVGAAFPKLWVPAGRSLLSYLVERKFTRKKKWIALDAQRERGWLAPGRRTMQAPQAGMEALTAALTETLRARLQSRFRLGETLTELPNSPNVVLCVPPAAATRLLAPADAELGAALAGVRSSPLVSATVFVRADEIKQPPRGVGVLMAEGERRELLGVLFNSAAFAKRAGEGYVSCTFLFGGTGSPDSLLRTDAELTRMAREEMRMWFGLRGEPAHVAVFRWPRAIPLYDAKLAAVWEIAARGWCRTPGKVLFANWTGQVSIRGMIEYSRAFNSADA